MVTHALKLTKPQRTTHSRVDTISFSVEEATTWPLPPFQRELRVNDKVRALAEEIGRDGGVLPGILSFGILNGRQYLIDGQHRRQAFLLSGQETGYADVRYATFETMAEMGEEFVRLNSALVKMRPDDILRGMESSITALKRIRSDLPFVGYDMIRRGASSPVLSMSILLRAWAGSADEIPKGKGSAYQCASQMDDAQTVLLIKFLRHAFDAWGRDEEYSRLWGALNLTLCMWLYRRVVVARTAPRHILMDDETFCRALGSLSASNKYLEWLEGRLLTERDRAPAYTRITDVMGGRVSMLKQKKVIWPRPAWALGKKGR